LAAGQSLKVTVALTKAARTLLTHFKRLPVRLAVTLTGANGKTTTVSTSKALTIKPPKAKAKKRR
jgi:UDP-N-acetylmuramoylalanine-D-glutamate ligase